MDCRLTVWSLPLAILLIAGARAKVIPATCDGIVIDGIEYEKEILKESVPSAYMLAVDYETNHLFFSYSTNDEDVFKSAFVNLKTLEFGNISGIDGGFANAVDGKHHRVYLGGRDGIYEFSYDTHNATQLGAENHNIWNAFYKDLLYYTTYPDEDLFIYKDGESEFVEKLKFTNVQLVVIDKDDTMFVSNSSGLYGFEHDKETGKFYGEYAINGMTTDAVGNVFFSTVDSICTIQDDEVKKLATFDLVYGVAVQGDGTIIYATDSSVIRLNPTKTKCISQ